MNKRTMMFNIRGVMFSTFFTISLMSLSFTSSAHLDDSHPPIAPIINFLFFDTEDDLLRVLNITDPFLFSNSSTDCADYASPYEAFVRDVQNDKDFVMAVEITSTEEECVLTSNNIPNHNFNATGRFATQVSEVERSFNIPRNPVMANQTTPLGSYYDGVFLNGVPLDILSAGCYDPENSNSPDGNVKTGCNALRDEWMLDPLSPLGTFGTDEHNAHAQPDGGYHYHGNPVALFANANFVGTPDNASPVIGFAADGFPIFGSFINDNGTIRKVVSGYELKQGSRGTQSTTPPVNPGGTYDGTYRADWEFTGAGDLDECNGMTVDGEYGYYVTDTFPWVIACLVGTLDDSFSKGGGQGN